MGLPNNQILRIRHLCALAATLISLVPGQAAHADDLQNVLGYREIQWNEISAESLVSVPIEPTERGLLPHPNEKRGFVSVPIDYSDPFGRQIEIFYRLLPSNRSTTAASGNPVLVIMNGGPGMPSSGYRALDHNYAGKNEGDALGDLSNHFRVLLVDQRGTGNSAALDLDNPVLSPEVIARFFDSDEHARDHARVINEVIPKGEAFFILARSYGGEIGFHYLTLSGDLRQPAGMIFSSAVLPHTDGLETFRMRREKQKELNLELQAAIPGIVAKLNHLGDHLASLGIDRGLVNFLWSDLGKGEGWKTELDTKIDNLIANQDRADVEETLGRGTQASVNLLNYVLSSSSLTAGYTDRTMTEETSRLIPFDDWMIDENWTLNQIGNDGTWREIFIASVDRSPPPRTQLPPVVEIRRALAQNQVLFTFGQSDAFLPQDLQFKRAQRLSVPGHTEFQILSGGHGAAFSAAGARTVSQWAAQIIKNASSGSDWSSGITKEDS